MTVITRGEEIAMSDPAFERERERDARMFGKLNPAIVTTRTGLDLYRELHVAFDSVAKPSDDATRLMAAITRVRHAYNIPLDK